MSSSSELILRTEGEIYKSMDINKRQFHVFVVLRVRWKKYLQLILVAKLKYKIRI